MISAACKAVEAVVDAISQRCERSVGLMRIHCSDILPPEIM
jgi:hypothetical protein